MRRSARDDILADNNIKGNCIFGSGRNVFFLGLVSFFTDISSEMIFTLIPLFLVNVLGAAPIVVGLLGGISDNTEALLKIYSGRLAVANDISCESVLFLSNTG